MSKYIPLDDKTKQEIVKDFMQERIGKAKKVDHPKIVLVGAQPGAGKSKAAKLVKKELSQIGGYIHVDADVMRERISSLAGVVYSSTDTQADAGALAQAVRKQAKEQQQNIVEEGTFRSGLSGFIEGSKKAGYGVEILAVATAAEESLAGIFHRYEKQHESGTGQPRFVPEEYHDNALNGFKESLGQCENLFDRVRVISRTAEILYDSQGKNQYETAKKAIEAHQELSHERLAAVAQTWDIIQLKAEKRNHDPVQNYFEKVKTHREEIHRELDKSYQRSRLLVMSSGLHLQRNNGENWADIGHTPGKGMKPAVHLLGNAKKAEAGQSYEGEIIYKDDAAVFQKTRSGLVRHQSVQRSENGEFFLLSEKVTLGATVTIHNGQVKLHQANTHKRGYKR